MIRVSFAEERDFPPLTCREHTSCGKWELFQTPLQVLVTHTYAHASRTGGKQIPPAGQNFLYAANST